MSIHNHSWNLKVTLVIFLGLLSISCTSQKQIDQLIPFQTETGWGWIDKNKNLVLPASYDSVGFFTISLGKKYNNFAIIKKNGQFGMVDKKGKLFLPPKYDHITNGSLSTSKGRIGTLQIKGEQFFFSSNGKLSKDIIGKRLYGCAFGLGSGCLSFSKTLRPQSDQDSLLYEMKIGKELKANHRIYIDYQNVSINVDSVKFSVHGSLKVVYRTDKKIAICSSNKSTRDEFEHCTEYQYDEIQMIQCDETTHENSYEHTIKVRIGNRWGLIEVLQYHPATSIPNQVTTIATAKYLQIIKKTGNFYLVEYKKGKFGYLFAGYGKGIECW